MNSASNNRFDKLPPFCYANSPRDGSIVVLRRGEMGFWPTSTAGKVEDLNAKMNVTPRQAAAMLCGSLCGFHVTGADPDAYDERGAPLIRRPSERYKPLKADHALIASVFRSTVVTDQSTVVSDGSFERAVWILAVSLANAFHQVDPSFEPRAFLDACNLDRDH